MWIVSLKKEGRGKKTRVSLVWDLELVGCIPGPDRMPIRLFSWQIHSIH